jgi:hypothetical protein
MSRRTIPLLAGLLAATLVAQPAEARHPRPAACSGGRFLATDPLGTPEAAGTPVALTLEAGHISIGSACPPVTAKVRARPRGTMVRAHWTSCGRVRLRAMIDLSCNTMQGVVRRKGRRRPFTAARSACGDGVIDGDAGESCEPPGVAGCSAQCGKTGCQPAYASTWQAIEVTVFAGQGCTAAVCHGAGLQGGLDLRPDAAYAALVGVPSLGAPDEKRVEPGSPDNSFLWRKLAKATRGLGGVPGAAMPNGLPPLSNDQLDGIARWIRSGAPENGTVDGADALLGACTETPTTTLPSTPTTTLPGHDTRIPPPADQGVQLHTAPWTIPPGSEREVCFATYYDFSATIPASAQAPCPDFWGGPSKQCFFYDRSELTQSPNSHHSIIHVYKGAYDVTDPSFGPFTCRGGPHDGQSCNPKGVGQPAPGGADCGEGGGCGGRIVTTVNCIGYGPPDYGFDGGGGTANSPQIGGAQSAYSDTSYAPGVYAMLPVAGIAVWDSHAFNLGTAPTTNEQWFNLYFAPESNRRWAAQAIFDLSSIFVQNVPPFQIREYCATHTMAVGSRLFQLSSHNHKRGKLFRVWGPGIAPCSGAGCLPESGPPVLTSTEYSDPEVVDFDPPVALDGADLASRTYKFCCRYDNGATDPAEVKRQSTSPPPVFFLAPGGPCTDAEVACMAGPRKGQPCNGDDRACDSVPGANDGVCDACPLRGGVTTEDEMMILLGFFYQVP